MKRRILLAIVALIVATSFLGNIAPAKAAPMPSITYTLTCNSLKVVHTNSDTGSADHIHIIASTSTTTLVSTVGFLSWGVPNSVTTFNYTFPAQPVGTSINLTLVDHWADIFTTVACSNAVAPSAGPAVKWFEPNDDRVNRDAGAPAVLYCRNKGDMHIYKVEADTSWGKIALVVTKAQVDAVVNSNPTANTLIKQSADGSVKVFYLPGTKEFSLIAKDSRPPYKPYSFVWKGCA